MWTSGDVAAGGARGVIHELRTEPGPSAYRADWAITSMSPSQHGLRRAVVRPRSGTAGAVHLFRCASGTGKRSEHDESTLSNDEGKRGRGRLQLLLIIGVVLGPMLLASAMYRFGFWVPESRNYDGVLIANGGTVRPSASALQRPSAAGSCWSPRRRVARPNASNWSTARQINIGLAREAPAPAMHWPARRRWTKPTNSACVANTRSCNAIRWTPPSMPATPRHPPPQLWIVDPTAIWCCATTSAPTARRFSTT